MESTLIELWRYAQVVLGVGLVIFVHECGHFIAARLSGVRVEVFSLGFGPKLLGWRRGPTLYQWALFPLGGYVKMAGEESHGGTPARDELGAKSVGQRFFIYSGGVLANIAFGLVVFPFILSAGVPFAEPLLGPSSPGSPAWHANLKPGSRVLSVNGNEVFGFIHIPNEVALGSPDETVVELVEPGAQSARTVHITPVYSTEMGAFTIGVRPAVDPRGTISVDEGSPASEAGLETGDRLVSVDGALPELPIEDRLFMAMRDGAPIQVTVEREGKRIDARLEPRESPEARERILGVTALYNRVLDIRDTELAKRLGLEKDDRLLSLNARPILREYDFLRAWVEAAGPAVLRVDRAGGVVEITLPELQRAQRIAAVDDIAIVPDADGARVAVAQRTAAEQAGLQDGDRVLRIDGAEISTFNDIADAGRKAKEGRALHFSVERRGIEGTPQFLEFEVAPRVRLPLTYGLGLQSAQYVYQTQGPVEAVRVGVAASWKFIEESWLTLKRILLGQVSGNNIGGIITIGVVSHSWASVGITKLLFFLCMLSMNLAFLNLLPIPVLDGGHLFFLLIEKIKGSPVSERVLGYSQMVGIVLILSLMVYVTFNDVMRWIVR